jgi:hypothetical protein
VKNTGVNKVYFLMVVSTNMMAFWNIMPCSLVEVVEVFTTSIIGLSLMMVAVSTSEMLQTSRLLGTVYQKAVIFNTDVISL